MPSEAEGDLLNSSLQTRTFEADAADIRAIDEKSLVNR